MRRVLFISLAVNVLATFFFVGKRIYYADSTKYDRLIKDQFEAKNDSLVTITLNLVKLKQAREGLFKMLPVKNSDIVFIGNSLIEGFPLQEMFGNANIKNRGIAGCTTEDALKITEEVANGKPRKIFLEIGINDLGKELSMDTILSNFQKICSVIRTKTPSTSLYVHSVLPTGMERAWLVPKVEQYNAKLKSRCRRESITFIDLYPAFIKDETLNTALTYDGLHLNNKGYLLWKEQIEALVKE